MPLSELTEARIRCEVARLRVIAAETFVQLGRERGPADRPSAPSRRPRPQHPQMRRGSGGDGQ